MLLVESLKLFVNLSQLLSANGSGGSGDEETTEDGGSDAGGNSTVEFSRYTRSGQSWHFCIAYFENRLDT